MVSVFVLVGDIENRMVYNGRNVEKYDGSVRNSVRKFERRVEGLDKREEGI